MMPSFLSIPQEIRDTILELAIANGSPPPETPETAGEYIELHDIEYKSWLGGQFVFYPKESTKTTALPLLLICRDIHSQTLAALSRIPIAYTLDVMLVKEHQLWATWTSIPTLDSKIDHVHTIFRIIPSKTRAPGYTGFRGGDGSPPALYWQLYSLLERSLQCGPGGSGMESKFGITSIQVLELDIHTPANVPEDRYIRSNASVREKGVYYVISPRPWFDFVRSGIQTLLSMYRDAAPMGRILYERVGKIRIMLDGVVHEEIDLAKRLSETKYDIGADDGYPKSRRRWVGIMKRIYKMREEAGLPVVEFRHLE